MSQKTITLIMTGASGAQYGLRLLEQLLHRQHKVYLLLSRPAQVVINTETTLKLPGRMQDIQKYLVELYQASPSQLQVFEREQGMPPLSAIACGSSRNLIERAADVTLKEKKPLILVVRETPFSEIHLENMLKLARMGSVILPANPGFYNRPQSVEDVVDFIVARVLDHLHIEHDLTLRWG